MSKKLKLTKIELETKDGKKVQLSLTEAKELHNQLHELFGEKYVPRQRQTSSCELTGDEL